MNDTATLEERFAGSLLGLAVGDALGAHFEGQTPQESYEQTIANVTTLGWTDTIAAMSGAISGTYLGVDSIPSHLLLVGDTRRS